MALACGPAYHDFANRRGEGGLGVYKKILVPLMAAKRVCAVCGTPFLLANDLSASLRLIYVVHDYLVADGRHGLANGADC